MGWGRGEGIPYGQSLMVSLLISPDGPAVNIISDLTLSYTSGWSAKA